MEKLSQNFLNQLSALVNCDPDRCAKSGCPLYYEEIKKCDAHRFIGLFSMIMHEKLKNIQIYDPFSDEDIV